MIPRLSPAKDRVCEPTRVGSPPLLTSYPTSAYSANAKDFEFATESRQIGIAFPSSALAAQGNKPHILAAMGSNGGTLKSPRSIHGRRSSSPRLKRAGAAYQALQMPFDKASSIGCEVWTSPKQSDAMTTLQSYALRGIGVRSDVEATAKAKTSACLDLGSRVSA